MCNRMRAFLLFLAYMDWEDHLLGRGAQKLVALAEKKDKKIFGNHVMERILPPAYAAAV